MTAVHLRVILDQSQNRHIVFQSSSAGFGQGAGSSRRSDVVAHGPADSSEETGGGVRGMVCRLVTRTIAQLTTPAVEAATSPFLCALATKAREECLAHAIQSLTDLDSRATVLSIDGISAFGLISGVAMLGGLHPVRGGYTTIPIVLQFDSEPLTTAVTHM